MAVPREEAPIISIEPAQPVAEQDSAAAKINAAALFLVI